MELRLHSHRWATRAPDWTAAAVSGFVAGALLMVMELLWSAIALGTTPWETSNMVAAIVMGPGVLHTTGFSMNVIAIALVTHYLLGIVFGLVFAAAIASFHFDTSDGMVVFMGGVYGLLLYVFNFYGVERFFPWFAEMRSWSAVAAHLVFGVVLAGIYLRLGRSSDLQ